MKRPMLKSDWKKHNKPLALLIVSITLAVMILSGCAKTSTISHEAAFCAIYHRQKCAAGDKQCIANELNRYCLCADEVGVLPKSVMCK